MKETSGRQSVDNCCHGRRNAKVQLVLHRTPVKGGVQEGNDRFYGSGV